MKSQKYLQYGILAFMAVVVLAILMKSDFVRNVVFSLGLLILLVVIPFVYDTIVRFLWNPFVDSINERLDKRPQRTENFPLWLRVLNWVFWGLVLASLWGFIVPIAIAFPLYFGQVALDWGAKTLAMTDGAWQWGWSIVFVVQFLFNFIWGWAKVATEGYGDAVRFSTRFIYPSERDKR